MPLEPRDAAYLWDMLDAAQAITSFIRGKSLEDYLADRMLRGAVERNLEVIGEAARQVSRALREESTPRSRGGPLWLSAMCWLTSTGRSATSVSGRSA